MPVARRTSPEPESPPAADRAQDVAALQARVAELEARDADRARSEAVQAALYRIAEAASGTEDLQDFYKRIHAIVGELMDAENFYIALYDDQRQAINFPYYVDSVETDIPDPAVWEPFGVGNASGTTAFVLRTGRPVRLDAEKHVDLERRGEITLVGVRGPGDWLGAPLTADGRVLGVIAVQSYADDRLHTDADLDLLAFVGQHIGSALSRARAIEETRQRNAELALINEIGEALAQQLEFGAIIDLVGERVRAIFNAASMFIALHDPATDTMTFPYDMDEGERFERGVFPVGPGMTSTVLRTGRPLRLSTIEEQKAAGAIDVGGTNTMSWLGVPIHAGDRVIGVVGLENVEAHAYSEADERLLATLASSMGVALDNARLLGETKRLAHRDRRARGRVGDHQRRPARARGRARSPGDVRARRGQDPGDLRCAGRRHRDLRSGGGVHALSVRHRARGPLPGRTDADHRGGPRQYRGGRAGADQRRPGLGARAGTEDGDRPG